MAYRKVDKGDRVSEYILLQKLGEGGFGEVWKAEHSQIPGKYVAIKIPTNPESMDLLKKEAVFQDQLDHPRIVKTIGLNTRNDPPYFIMEFVEGKNLRQLMLEDGILPPPYAIDIAVQVLEALAYAHSQNIVHKDIKPENILVEKKKVSVSDKGKALLHYVKITDLGLGFLPGRPETELMVSDNARTTGVRLMSGTLFYMCPEQMVPDRAVDGRADIYSLGVVLYEMITGELPLGMDLPSELNPVLTPELDAICKKALSIDRDFRYQDATEMEADLHKAKEQFLLKLVESESSGADVEPILEPKGLTPRALRMAEVAAPGGIPQKKKRKLEFTLLGIIFLLLGVSLWTSIRLYHVESTLPPEEASSGAESPLLAGALVITSDPPGATVRLNGVPRGETPFEWKNPPYEMTEIRLSAEFYRDRIIHLEPRPDGALKRFAVLDEGRPEQIRDATEGLKLERIKLRRSKGALRIDTLNVDEVNVRIDKGLYGSTPFSTKIDAGYHILTLEKEGYEPYEEKIRIDPQASSSYTVPMTPKGASSDATSEGVWIHSHPSGAEIVLDGVSRGQSPLQLKLPRGEYSLRVLRPYFKPHEQKLLVTTTATEKHVYALQRIQVKVTFDSVPRGASVLVDGHPIGVTPVIEYLEGGKHEISLQLAGYRSPLLPLEIASSAQVDPVVAILEKIPPGVVTVEAEIAGVPVFLDGKRIGTLPLSGKSLEPGKYRVRVLGIERIVMVKPGKAHTILFTREDLGLVHIPAGLFTYGSQDPLPGQLSAQKVKLPAYMIDRFEVTNAQYALFLSDLRKSGDHSTCHPNEGQGKDHTPSKWKVTQFNGKDYPVVGVDFWDAYAYARWCGKRLPTEKEWEKAARGTDAYVYPWGDLWDPSRLNWADFVLKKEPSTQPVGSFPLGASPYGCMDMAGNVAEWCMDNYDPDSEAAKVVRGGSFLNREETIAFSRWRQNRSWRAKTLGFRCVLDLKK